MASVIEIMQLCRLCLEKDEVNTPIFEGQSDRQIFLKISACLPVKVSKEDKLPKNICDGCSCKLEMLYQFWNTSANAEKKLIRWLDQIGTDKLSDKEEAAVALQSQHSISSDPVVLKQEVVDVADNQSTGDDLVPDDLNVSNDSQEYLLQQEQLPYQPVEFQFQQDGFDAETADDNLSQNVESEPLPKQRKRRAAAMKALPAMDSEDEDDPDLINTKIAKTEEQSEESGGEDMTEPTTFVGVPSADDDEQPGPSGVGKASGDAPLPRLPDSSEDNSILYDKLRVKFSIKPCIVYLNKLALVNKSDSNCPISPKDTLNVFGKLYQKPTYNCGQCKEVFDNVVKFKRHSMIHKLRSDKPGVGKQFFKCYICMKKFYDRRALWGHMRIHSGKTNKKQLKSTTSTGTLVSMKFRCTICMHNCADVYEMREHKNLHKNKEIGSSEIQVPSHSEKPVKLVCPMKYRCNICMRKFADVHDMREHKKTHTKEEKPSPPIQMSTYSDKITAKTKVIPPYNLMKYRCSICRLKFADVNVMREHKKSHTSTSLIQVTTSLNENLFTSTVVHNHAKSTDVHEMLEHIKERKNTTEKVDPQFKCCQQIFVNLNFLCIHMYQTFAVAETDTCDPQYVCSTCSTTFSGRTQWKDHSVKMHGVVFEGGDQNSVNNICNICNVQYDDVVKLVRHRLTVCKTVSLTEFFGVVEAHENAQTSVQPTYTSNDETNSFTIMSNEAVVAQQKNIFSETEPIVLSDSEEESNSKIVEPGTELCKYCGQNFRDLYSHLRYVNVLETPNGCNICNLAT